MPKYKLMKHQKAGVAFLETVDGIGALLYEPGVGKTGTTLSWVDKQAKRKGEFRVLVVAPKTAVDTWVLQPEMFMDSTVKARMLEGSTISILRRIEQGHNWSTVPDTKVSLDHKGDANRVTILAMSAGAISSFCTERGNTIKMLRSIRTYAPDLIVVDESHIIKSATANISKAMYQIGQLADHRIILTGTVNPHSPLDVYGQWRFLAPWTFSDQADKKFVRKPLKMTEEQKKSIRPWPFGRMKARYATQGFFNEINGFRNLEDLNARVAQRSHVVLKADALDLPPTTDIDIHVTLNAKERKAYNEMRDDLAAELADGSLLEAPNALAKMMKLRQIASGFVKDTDTDEVHVIGDSIQRAVSEVVNVQLAGEKRVVVFAYFRRECEALAQALSKGGQKVEIITGATSSKERLAIRKRFGDVSRNPERTILVAQARTMSISVNELVSAQHAVYASMSERRDDWVQSRGRLDRQGQTKPVTFWNCFVPGSVGEVMMNNHKQRGNLEKAMLDHVRAARPL